MNGSVARYHARQPRYVLNTDDNNLIRYSGAERFSWEEKTELKNISLTGLSFLAPTDIKPRLGEVIQIQFSVPESKMMACHAIVTRIEPLNSDESEIAVHFHKLERVQRINLVQGLTIKNARHAADETQIQFRKNQKLSNFIGMTLAAALWLAMLNYFFL